MNIRAMTEADWPQVAAIFAQGIAMPNVTFRTDVPDWPQFDAEHLRAPRLIAEEGGVLLGWVAVSPVSARPCYRGVVELSLYVGEHARNRGVGKALLHALTAEADRLGIWTIEAHIFRENRVSILLHEHCGFRYVGYRERIGFDRDGVWHTSVLMERRCAGDLQP